MTTKTSLFNKGIYKSTVKRYAWGSILYTILIFMMSPLSILLNYDKNTGLFGGYQRGNPDVSILFKNNFSDGLMLLAMAVPTVAGLLVFRFIHSKKAAVFTHSLPVSRTANYISSVCAGFTLMAVPVIINAVVLMIMSICGYGEALTLGDCTVWMLLNLFALFIMFSCTCFVASITGNSFAMIVLNIFMHVFLLIIAGAMDMGADAFLFGYSQNAVLTEAVLNGSFPGVLVSIVGYGGINETVNAFTFITPIAVSILFYGVAFLLYKKRSMEKAEDVAGFKWLNPVFKYLVTFTGALAAFLFCASLRYNGQTAASWIIVLVISAIIYFACEMLLKKSFRVFKSYKGFLVEAAICTVFVCLLANTSFFGFETRIPDIEDVKSVKLNSAGYYGDYYEIQESRKLTEDPVTIELTHQIHSDIIKNRDKYDTSEDQRFYIEIVYELKNGKTMERFYILPEEKCMDVMQKMYSSEDYKKKNHPIFTEFYSVESASLCSDDVVDIENAEEFIECIRKDVENLSYKQIYNDGWGITFNARCFVETGKDSNGKSELVSESLNMQIKPGFTNSVNWLVENGYWEKLKIKNNGIFYIVEEYEDLPFIENGEITQNVDLEKEKGIIKLEGKEAKELIDLIQNAPYDYTSEEKFYEVYKVTNLDDGYVVPITRLSQTQVDSLAK